MSDDHRVPPHDVPPAIDPLLREDIQKLESLYASSVARVERRVLIAELVGRFYHPGQYHR